MPTTSIQQASVVAPVSSIRVMTVAGPDMAWTVPPADAAAQIALIGLAQRGEDVTRVYAMNKPDVVVMPQVLRGQIDGLEATRRLREVFPKAKVMLLMNAPSAETLYSALQANVSAILPMTIPLNQLVSVIAQVHAEDICWIEPRMARLLPSLFSTPSGKPSGMPAGVSRGAKSLKKESFAMTVPSQETFACSEDSVIYSAESFSGGFSGTTTMATTLPQKRFASNPAGSTSKGLNRLPEGSSSLGLTSREVDVLKLIAEGRTNQEIARHLVITQNTVKTHMKNIFQKLDVSDRTGAAVKALRENLLD